MPTRDREKKNQQQREWYARNADKVKAKVKAYKHTHCVGVCRNCGGPTHGNSLKDIPNWCRKPECARVQRLQYRHPNDIRPA